MKDWRLIIFIANFGCLGLFFSASVNAGCIADSADHCLSMVITDQLPELNNQALYCSSAVVAAYRIEACLAECNFIASNAIQMFFSEIGKNCSGSSSCQDPVSLYSTLSSCFDKYGGLETLAKRIIVAFNSKQKTSQDCMSLAQGKYCLKSLNSSCDILSDLSQAIYQIFPLLSYVQHICGSESVPDMMDTSTCDSNNEMVSKIQLQCNIACSISATADPDTICQFLQDQVNCILRLSQGCTAVEMQFLLPRLNTYAIANMGLKCSPPIEVRGVTIQPTGLSPDYPENFQCKYISQINSCFKLGLTDSIRPDVIEMLFNGNFVLDPLCQSQSNQQDVTSHDALIIAQCTNSYLSCRLPVAEVYGQLSYNSNYNSSLGPFLLDDTGLKTVLSTLSCPNPKPPTVCPKLVTTPGGASATPRHPTPPVTRRSTPSKGRNTPTPRGTTHK